MINYVGIGFIIGLMLGGYAGAFMGGDSVHMLLKNDCRNKGYVEINGDKFTCTQTFVRGER